MCSSNILKTSFLKHLWTMASLSLIEKGSVATTRDSFKDCIPAIINQMHTNFEKKKFHKQSVVILLKNGCSVRQMSCTISLRLFVAKALEKHVRSSSFSISLFQRKLHSHGKFTERLFLLQLLYTKFFKLIFFRTPISGWW